MHINNISFSMVKNEADIIETFVRHNLQYIDKMIIADNLSTDNTLLILQKLQEEGLPIEIVLDTEQAYFQNQKMTNLYHKYAEQYTLKNVFFLDADEFLCGPKEELEENFSPGKVYQLPMKNYLLLHSSPTRVSDNMQYIAKNSHGVGKIMLCHSTETFRNTFIDTGNHSCRYNNIRIEPERWLSLYLGHAAIRSKNQFLTKYIIGRIGLALRNKNDTSTGISWHREFNFLKDHDYVISDNELLEHLYGTSTIEEIVKNAEVVPAELIRVTLHYEDLVTPPNLLKMVLDSYMDTITNKVAVMDTTPRVTAANTKFYHPVTHSLQNLSRRLRAAGKAFALPPLERR